MPYMKRFSRCLLVFVVALSLTGCLASQMAGDLIRSGQKSIDVVMADGVDASTLRGMNEIAVSINGVNESGQFVVASGAGSTNTTVFSDLLTKELIRSGYQAGSVDAGISESSDIGTFRALRSRGYDMVIVGNMNLGATSSSVGVMTGGEYFNAGVTAFTLKGLDARDGSILFIMSGDYGKSKDADEVVADFAAAYEQTLAGNAPSADDDAAAERPASQAATGSAESTQGAQASGSVAVERDGSDVAWAQQSLNALGYECGSVDGALGPQTRACIRTFQEVNELSATSRLDRSTIATLERLLEDR